MDARRLLIGTVLGGVLMAVVGFLLYEVLLSGFFEAQLLVSGRETPIFWAAALSSLTHALLLTLVVGWAGASSLGDGLKIGALVGFLVWFGADTILYGAFEFSTLTGAVADSICSIVPFGVAGAAIAAAAGGASARAAASAA